MDLAWWALTVLCMLSWFWVTALLVGYVRLRRMLKDVSRTCDQDGPQSP